LRIVAAPTERSVQGAQSGAVNVLAGPLPSIGTTTAESISSISTPITPGDVQRLRERGFCGIHLDLRGYEPGPLAETQVMLQALLGDPIANGREGAWLTYSLEEAGQ